MPLLECHPTVLSEMGAANDAALGHVEDWYEFIEP
jgi:hypothetical protein